MYTRFIIPNLFCLTILASFSCAGHKATSKKDRTISIHVTVHEPYCGGALPSNKQEKGSFTSAKYQTFHIKPGKVNNDSTATIAKGTTDQTGSFTVSLASGSYSLFLPEKDQPFESFFQQMRAETTYLKAQPEICFKNWWRSPEAIIHIIDSTKFIELTIERTCYSGFNPCMNYIGPKRP